MVFQLFAYTDALRSTMLQSRLSDRMVLTVQAEKCNPLVSRRL